MSAYRVLVVDDDPEVRYTLRAALDRDGMEIEEADTGGEGVERVGSRDYDLILLDYRLPDARGIDLIEEMRRQQPDLLVVMMTAYGSRRTAVEAVRRGAYDFFTKPIKLDELRVVMSRALEKRDLSREVTKLRSRLAGESRFGDIIGGSPAMQRVFETLGKVVDSDTTVLVLGESGTGQELVAQAIHD
ncbi:MAG: sigma-54-dependent transcriptional regulator, partial [Acidobacteriota bacterium]